MGHVRNYTLGDVVARYKNASYNVYTLWLGCFGLPAENAAMTEKTSSKLDLSKHRN